MIWNCTKQAPANPLVKHIQAELAAAGIAAADGAAPGAGTARRQAAAEAVAAYLRQEGRTAVATEHLLLLTARALWAVGEEHAARRLVHAGGQPLGFSRHYADAACAAGITADDWAPFFASRAVRPAEFPSLGGGTLWILDMARLLPGQTAGLELAALRAMQAALTRLAHVWDGARGNGLLGLSRLRQAAGLILDAPPASRKARRLAAELARHCWACLEILKTRRGWTHQPGLISLDLH